VVNGPGRTTGSPSTNGVRTNVRQDHRLYSFAPQNEFGAMMLLPRSLAHGNHNTNRLLSDPPGRFQRYGCHMETTWPRPSSFETWQDSQPCRHTAGPTTASPCAHSSYYTVPQLVAHDHLTLQ
jgi:hypothetical protein